MESIKNFDLPKKETTPANNPYVEILLEEAGNQIKTIKSGFDKTQFNSNLIKDNFFAKFCSGSDAWHNN